MARAKRNKPYNPAKVHDRRSRDLLRNADVAAVEVDDPLGLDPGDKIVTLRSLRNDPLGLFRLRLRKCLNRPAALYGFATGEAFARRPSSIGLFGLFV